MDDSGVIKTTPLYLDSVNSRVGIGTASPSEELEVSGVDNINIKSNSTGAGSDTGFHMANDAQQWEMFIRGGLAGDSHDALDFYDRTGTKSVLTLQTDGNVGIGTASPVSNLDVTDASGGVLSLSRDDTVVYTTNVFGRIQATGNDNSWSGSTIAGSISIMADGDNHPVEDTHPKSYMSFKTANGSSAETERMRIDSSGYVGIGDTSPSYQLELSTNSAAKPTSTLWTVPSDERLKDDIVLADLDKCYDIIQNLPLKRFKWKEDVYTNDQTDDRSVLGWIAQDVQSVFPKSVKENNFRGVSNNDAIQSIEAQDAVEWLDKPSEDNTKDEIKAWMDSNSLAYNSGDTKTDLIAKIPELKQEAIESVVGVDETYKLEIEDCLSIDADQIFRAMFGAIQKLQAKVEALESK
jgi:hypothetical protein